MTHPGRIDHIYPQAHREHIRSRNSVMLGAHDLPKGICGRAETCPLWGGVTLPSLHTITARHSRCLRLPVSQSAYLRSIFQNAFFFLVLVVAQQPEGMVFTLNSLACLEPYGAAPITQLRYSTCILELLSEVMYNTQIQPTLATSIPDLFLLLLLLLLL